jgi:HK97 gp10 family phage protein
MGVEISGLKETVANITRLGGRAFLNREVARSGRKAMKPVLVTAKSLVPRDEGDLFDSLVLKSKVLRNKNVSIRVGPSTVTLFKSTKSGKMRKKRPTNYGMLVEKGTSKAKPKPYLRPAYDQHEGSIEKTFAEEMNVSLQKAVKKFG